MSKAPLPTQAADFPRWYGEVVRRAELAEHSLVRGCSARTGSAMCGDTTIRGHRTPEAVFVGLHESGAGSGSARSILRRNGSTARASCRRFARRTGLPGSFGARRGICAMSRLCSRPGAMRNRRLRHMSRWASSWCTLCPAGSSISQDDEFAVLRVSGMLCPSTIPRTARERVPCASWVTSSMPWSGFQSRFSPSIET